MIPQETIVALATPSGAGAIAIIRLSGTDAITLAAEVFQSGFWEGYYETEDAYDSFGTYR